MEGDLWGNFFTMPKIWQNGYDNFREVYWMKRVKCCSLFLGVALVAVALLGFSSQSIAADKAITLQLSGAYSAKGDSPRALATHKIKELIEEKSDGKITVNLYMDSQLGGDREILEGCQFGDISMVSQTTAPQVAFIPELAIFDIPMLFDDLDVAREALSGPFRDTLAKWYDRAGLKLLLFEPIYYRETTTNRAINKLEDFEGLKIRTMENKYHLAFWKALNANPTPLNFAELYVALQQGLVDAQENPYEVVGAHKFYEVQKYLVNTNHIAFILSVNMNKAQYENMSDNYKKIVEESMQEVGESLYNRAKAKNQELQTMLQEKGMTILNPSPELLKQMKDAAATVEKMVRKDVGDEIVDSVMRATEAAKK